MLFYIACCVQDYELALTVAISKGISLGFLSLYFLPVGKNLSLEALFELPCAWTSFDRVPPHARRINRYA